MLLAPKPIAEQLRAQAREFLVLLRDKQYDQGWNYMITWDAIELISTASFPLHCQRQGKGDAFLSHSAIEGMSLAFQEDHTFPGDDKGIRTAFFDSVANGLERMGWFELFDDESSKVFLKGSAAVVVADTTVTRKAFFLPLVEEGRGEYKIDLEAPVAFSMVISAQSLHRFATRAMEADERRSALAIYDLAARLSGAYTRLRQVMWAHPFVEKVIKDQRKQELQAEYAYTILAKDQVDTLLADPRIAEPSVDVGAFLADTFSGYSKIVDTESDEGDLARLMAMDDAALRSAIARILIGVDRVEAEREARKPHGIAEIADMEVMVRRGDALYHLLMPFKSGREITGRSVPAEVFYQILRPHLFFRKGIVVFITARPCSQFLHNYIKQARDRMGLPIGVIEERDLGRLLKLNGLL